MNANIRMQLVDLARTLTQRPELQLVMSYHSYLTGNTLSISQFWADYPLQQQVAGFKSEVYLQCIGGSLSDALEIHTYLEHVKSYPLPSFSKQLFALFEQLRTERVCNRLRPGTTKTFKVRRELLQEFFRKQVVSQLFAGATADALFSAIYLRLTSNTQFPEMPDPLTELLAGIDILLHQVGSASTTKAAAELAESIMTKIRRYVVSDMTRSYFSIESVYRNSQETSPTKARGILQNDLDHSSKIQTQETNNSREQEKNDERENLPTWHRETQQSAQTFLQFELEQGTQSNVLGDALRETDPGDQALALVQGSTRQSKRSEFSEAEAIDKHLTELLGVQARGNGNINLFARAIWKVPERASDTEREKYRKYKEQVWPYKQKLTRSIQMTLEQKRSGARSDLLFGRLDKKLIRAMTEGSYRLFYKKKNPEPPLDAVFLLLVDCSASMQDKMEETKLGITLFHESLKSLRIPHSIIGFWEDADHVTAHDEPNVFQVIMDFESSLKKNIGASILQLEAQQDNRDGFAIRMVSKCLAGRHEKNRIFLVFTDGEPAAAGYNENGILDAYQAVSEARRSGIDVVGLYLGNDVVTSEQAGMMQNIYGKNTVIVPGIEHLTAMLTPVLRKLLLKNY